jgi:hypothetical protein
MGSVPPGGDPGDPSVDARGVEGRPWPNRAGPPSSRPSIVKEPAAYVDASTVPVGQDPAGPGASSSCAARAPDAAARPSAPFPRPFEPFARPVEPFARPAERPARPSAAFVRGPAASARPREPARDPARLPPGLPRHRHDPGPTAPDLARRRLDPGWMRPSLAHLSQTSGHLRQPHLFLPLKLENVPPPHVASATERILPQNRTVEQAMNPQSSRIAHKRLDRSSGTMHHALRSSKRGGEYVDVGDAEGILSRIREALIPDGPGRGKIINKQQKKGEASCLRFRRSRISWPTGTF